MNPGMAFGTGTHPTTQLCLAMLETYVKPGDRVFDIGCGSGILSVAAVKLGAGTVLAVDIDPEAERATRENAALNDVTDKIEFRLGSLDLVLNAKQSGDDHSTTRLPDPSTSSQFPIVVANIFARVIINLLKDDLARTLAPGGALIVSGILVEQGDDVQAALHTARLTIIEQRQSGDWIAIAATRV
jgi:ribosomal protein L11 methyltransferase